MKKSELKRLELLAVKLTLFSYKVNINGRGDSDELHI